MTLSLEFEYQCQPKDKLIAGIISIYRRSTVGAASMTPMVNLLYASAKDISDQLTGGVVDSVMNLSKFRNSASETNYQTPDEYN
jgi:hypothetical protein